MSDRMPAIFFGHGNPMNALLVNPYTEHWAAIGSVMQRPKAILIHLGALVYRGRGSDRKYGAQDHP
jgi:aromatic ring-opening dioxygenase catalytic subunit (LigB family)